MSSVQAERRERTLAGEGARRRGLRATNWPLHDTPLRTTAVLVMCLLLALGCGVLSQSVSMGLLTLAAVLLSLWKLWIPITTEFDARGVVLSALRRRRRIAWGELDRVELHEDGVFLCTREESVPRGVFQSVFLPWSTERDSISAFCQDYRPLALRDWSGTAQSTRL